jgi:hypothetical protein
MRPPSAPAKAEVALEPVALASVLWIWDLRLYPPALAVHSQLYVRNLIDVSQGILVLAFKFKLSRVRVAMAQVPVL